MILRDILIGASAWELGATIVTMITADFALIGRYIDIAYVCAVASPSGRVTRVESSAKRD